VAHLNKNCQILPARLANCIHRRAFIDGYFERCELITTDEKPIERGLTGVADAFFVFHPRLIRGSELARWENRDALGRST
jgi:hypothetical protein